MGGEIPEKSVILACFARDGVILQWSVVGARQNNDSLKKKLNVLKDWKKKKIILIQKSDSFKEPT